MEGPGTARGQRGSLTAILLLAGGVLLSACTDVAPAQAPGTTATAIAAPPSAASPTPVPAATPAAVETRPAAGATPVPTARTAPPTAVAPGAAPPRAEPTPVPPLPTPGRSSARPPEELKHITVAISGRVETVGEGDGVITFDEAVHGFERVVVVEDTEILSASGDPGGMEDITPGTVIHATGAPDGDGGVIARSVRITPA
jgi:hypothetical protein